MKASSKIKTNRSTLREEDLKTPNSRVNVDKVISEIRTLRTRLSEITPVSSPATHKRKTTHFSESVDDSDREIVNSRDPFRVCISLSRSYRFSLETHNANFVLAWKSKRTKLNERTNWNEASMKLVMVSNQLLLTRMKKYQSYRMK